MRILRWAVVLLAWLGIGQAKPADDLRQLASEYVQARCHFFPVWATSIGIDDYDSLLTDYSVSSVYRYRNTLSELGRRLRMIDTTRLAVDERIDWWLLQANLAYDDFILVRFPYHELSPALYVEEALNSLHYLLLRRDMAEDKKAAFIRARLAAMPSFLRSYWRNRQKAVRIFYETAIEMAGDGLKLIDETFAWLQQVQPDTDGEYGRLKGAVATSLNDFREMCQLEKTYATGSPAIGRDLFEFLLKKVHYIDMSCDSLKRLGLYWYAKSQAAMDSLAAIIDSMPPIVDTLVVSDTFGADDVMEYYTREIDEAVNFLKEKQIVTVPDDIGACVVIETPAFMAATHRGIAYEPPPPLAKDQTGYFYVRPLPPFDSVLRREYYAYVANRGFKGGVVHEAFPGHHLQLSIANRHPSLVRKIQCDPYMAEGWALYCEEMATAAGYFGDDQLAKRWHAVWGGIRFRAVRVIVDCCLHDGTMTPDSALAFMNQMLGENTSYYTAEIRRYCANPTVASSYLIGKLMILQMLENQKERSAKRFSLKEFHDRLLAEGTISPSLIARKLHSNDK